MSEFCFISAHKMHQARSGQRNLLKGTHTMVLTILVFIFLSMIDTIFTIISTLTLFPSLSPSSSSSFSPLFPPVSTPVITLHYSHRHQEPSSSSSVPPSFQPGFTIINHHDPVHHSHWHCHNNSDACDVCCTLIISHNLC